MWPFKKGWLALKDKWGFINIVLLSYLVAKYDDMARFATFVVTQGTF